MKKEKIQKREIARIQYFIYCPICKQEIKGTKASQVDFNLDLHIKQKHKGK